MGLLYTILLSPLFYVWLVLKRQYLIVTKFFLLLAPFIFVHLALGVDLPTYAKSLILYLTTYIFCYTIYVFAKSTHNLEGIFESLAIFNFLLTAAALLLLFTNLRDVVWWNMTMTAGVDRIPRLMMLTYEPSYYATLLIPIITFFLLKFLSSHRGSSLWMTLVLALPLVLTYSLGVIAIWILSLILVFFFSLILISVKKKVFNFFLLTSFILAIIVVLLLVYYSDNPIFVRINNVLNLSDSSGRARTYEAFFLAQRIAELKSFWWGVGPGQIKILGHEIIMEFYNYPEDLITTVRIPNALAETYATFGVLGVTIKFLVIFYLFIKTKVFSNSYRAVLFLFIFFYQFTGSFITNLGEYVIWILAFTPVFPQFNRSAS